MAEAFALNAELGVTYADYANHVDEEAPCDMLVEYIGMQNVPILVLMDGQEPKIERRLMERYSLVGGI